MHVRFPLYAKVMGWFVVNLALVVALAVGIAAMQFRFGLDWLLAGPARRRLEAMGEIIAGELRDQPRPVWDTVLARYQDAHGCQFALFRNDGLQAGGEPLDPPPEVMQLLKDRRGPPPQAKGPRPDNRPPRSDRPVRDDRLPPDDRLPAPAGYRNPATNAPPARSEFMIRTSDPGRYWVGIHHGLTQPGPPNARPVTLLVSSGNLTGNGLFFDPLAWLGLGAAALVLSALIWLPIVGGITRAIRRVNTAAGSIAQGQFDVRVPDRRRDELGELGGSVNAMAARLGQLVEGQRRLTADVAHELCSPIARMQRALGIVEQRGIPEQAPYLAKLDAELQHMARLVEEVLSFSKTASLPVLAVPETFFLTDLVREVMAREAPDLPLRTSLPPGLALTTIREALDRALSNLLRNAVRYAGHAGPVELTAAADHSRVEITLRDHGPGVPADAMEKIFEPFYRPEAARQRSTGGTGLGLAIVKRCIEVCGGSVTAAPASPSGLLIRILLPGGHHGGEKLDT